MVGKVTVVHARSIDAMQHEAAKKRPCFAVEAVPKIYALTSAERVTMIFGAKTTAERDTWVHGLSVSHLLHSRILYFTFLGGFVGC